MKKQMYAVMAVVFTAGTVFFTSCKKEDTTAPVITITGGNTMTQSLPATAGGGSFTAPGATATDDEDGDVTGSITVDASGVNPDVKGTYNVTYTVTDAAGNTGSAVLAVTIVNDAEYLSGTYTVKDSVYSPSMFVSTYTETVTADTNVNNVIWTTKFGNYVNATVYMTISGTAVNIPSQTVNAGNPPNNRTFTNTVLSQGGTVTGTGAPGTIILIDYKETVTTPPSTANAIARYTKQ